MEWKKMADVAWKDVEEIIREVRTMQEAMGVVNLWMDAHALPRYAADTAYKIVVCILEGHIVVDGRCRRCLVVQEVNSVSIARKWRG